MLLYVYKSELSDRLGLISQRIRPLTRPGEQLNKKQNPKASQEFSFFGYRQWHLPFQTVLRLSLEADMGHYMITPERELTRKPLRMDFLILRLEEGYRMRSSLGKLLKKHTIIEYKGATDYLSLEDLFKGQAYASLYISSGTGDSSPESQKDYAFSEASLSAPARPGLAVPPEEMLLMFVCYPYPRKVMQFLQRTSVRIEKTTPGIYRFRLWCIDAAIIVQSRLDSAEYLWMKNLSSNVPPEDFDQMAAQQQKHPEDKALDDLIQFIYDNNPYLQKEGENVCKVFDDIRQKAFDQGKNEGFNLGKGLGRDEGENQLSKLIQILLKNGQMDDISAVISSKDARQTFYKRYGL